MSLPVFLADVTGVPVGGEVALTGDEGRHAVTVRRTRVGEQLELTDGRGTRALVEVSSTGKGTLSAVVRSTAVEAAATPMLTVVQAIPKGDRGELAVEVLTEVGADRIVPWAAARCVAVWKGDRAARSLSRWRNTASAAARQSRRAHWPVVAEAATTADVVTLVSEADVAVVLHEDGGAGVSGIDVSGATSVLLVVGPEGGLTDEEVATFRDAGAHVVRLGASVLRTSTAGVAGAAALLSRTPRWAAG